MFTTSHVGAPHKSLVKIYKGPHTGGTKPSVLDMYVCMYVCICMYVCMHACMYVCMFVCICSYICNEKSTKF